MKLKQFEKSEEKIMDMEYRLISVMDKENQDNVTKQILKDIIQYSTPKTNKKKI